eukprot:TRINITY_DN292_c0_g1_i4.p1 TRINITY_DN292_c0_g1~~TRINITY_DN292_c0_g1_i4.p1  ORF type:complete len:145 (+),score=45.97 TRINITY_DN292_c0_g1_i4:76-510(+)
MCIRDRYQRRVHGEYINTFAKKNFKEMEGQKKLLKPTDNKVQISTKREIRFFIFLAKIFMREFEEVELHALGEAISINVRVAEQLQRHGYATITRIETFTYEPDQKQTDNDQRRGGKRVKMVIKLKRSKEFLSLTASLDNPQRK